MIRKYCAKPAKHTIKAHIDCKVEATKKKKKIHIVECINEQWKPWKLRRNIENFIRCWLCSSVCGITTGRLLRYIFCVFFKFFFSVCSRWLYLIPVNFIHRCTVLPIQSRLFETAGENCGISLLFLTSALNKYAMTNTSERQKKQKQKKNI